MSIVGNLHHAADLLAAHPDIPQPYITSRSAGTVDLSWYLHNDPGCPERETAAAIIRTIGGKWDRGEANHSGPLAIWSQARDGLRLYISVSRDEVCERRVVGAEKVTLPAVPAQPERVEYREIVEWDCKPILSDGPVAS